MIAVDLVRIFYGSVYSIVVFPGLNIVLCLGHYLDFSMRVIHDLENELILQIILILGSVSGIVGTHVQLRPNGVE